MPGTHIALLRGINVGGKNKLPMAELAKLFTAAGCQEVRTYIQSGNVVFTAPDDVVATLAKTVTRSIQEQSGMSIPVILRTRDELAALIERNPYVAAGADPDALHVMALADQPSDQAVAMLDPERSPGDTFAVVGREIYLHCPQGLARTKLSNDYFDRRLGTVSTCRNWRTIHKLLELADA